MKFNNYWLLIILLLALVLGACTAAETPAAEESPTSEEPQELVVMTHDSFAVSESVVAAFEEEHNAKVSFIKSGDTGAALNRAILSKEAPIADVFYGVDNTFLSRALEAEIFEPYASPLLEKIPAEYQLDPNSGALPVDFGDVCINYDKSYFSENNLPVPDSLDALTDPMYANLLVVENPATSSPGLAFLLATIAHYGEEGYLDYWQQLRDNGVVVVNDWETAYYSNFSGSAGEGAQAMVVSYSSSPAAEVIFASEPLDEAPTASVLGKDTCFRQIEFAGILKGTEKRALAERFIDFMLDRAFQEDLPMQMFVYPVNTEAELPAEFEMWATTADEPASLDAALIAEKRESWIQAWDEIVLR
ncbi:MAG: thiamine ABC transporter substrate-binding protein [Anaerolineaceae bacterium]|nr:thiamine ABC transporter substrate-binding protein [Anaerolineaceae bacterium]